MASFVSPVNAAVVDALRDDSTLAATLRDDKVINGIAQKGTKYPYITLTNFRENGKGLFMAPGAEGKLTGYIWTHRKDELEVLSIYGAVNNVLDDRVLALSTGQMIRGKCELLLTGRGDPADPLSQRGVFEYTTWSVS
jgi:hypothetical protein